MFSLRLVSRHAYGLGCVVLAMLLTGAGARAGSVPMYTLTDLGTLPGASESFARAINASGQVVGDSGDHAFLYSDGAMHLLGTSGALINATAINAEGEVVGLSDNAGGYTQAFLYNDGVVRVLAPTLNTTFAWGINSSGQVVGEGDVPVGANTYDQAFLYADGRLQPLGSLQGPIGGSGARAINDLGQIVGESWLGPYAEHPILYSNGIMHDLGTLGGNYGYATAINNAGQIVGASVTKSGATHPFLYSGGVMHDLGSFGGTYSGAVAINDRGQVLVQSNAFGTMGLTPFLYTDGTAYELNDLIVSAPGYKLLAGDGINDSGEIAGTAEAPDGESHAVLLTPTSVPLPPAAWAALTALPILLIGRRLIATKAARGAA